MLNFSQFKKYFQFLIAALSILRWKIIGTVKTCIKFQNSYSYLDNCCEITMRGMSDLDSLCLREIFKNLAPLDLCSVRHCSKGLLYFVEDHFQSLYFIDEKLLDLTAESNGNVSKILKHFGKFCRHLKVHQKTKKPNLMLDVIVNNCGKTLKRLSLNSVHLYEMDILKFEGVFDNLETLELINCRGEQQSIEFEFPNLTTLKIISSFEFYGLMYSEGREYLKKNFYEKT